MSKQLTLELIMFKTKTNQLDKIKNLNLCANDLSDISIVNQMPSLEVLSLSVNAINSLEDIAECSNLQELYIRRNNVESLNELRYLQDLPKLRTLWLGENPVANIPGYRMTVIKTLPQLQKLDNQEISPQERQQAAGFVNADRQDSGTKQRPTPDKDSNGYSETPNSFAQAAIRQRGGDDQRVNPNSTTPFYKKSVTSPNLREEKDIETKPVLKKQNTRIVEARKKIEEQQNKKVTESHASGFIRRGTGLARTPPRQRPENSYSPNYQEEEPYEEQKSGQLMKDNSKSPAEEMGSIDENPLRKRPMTGIRDEEGSAGVMWPSSSSPVIGQGIGLSASPDVRRQEQPIGGNNPNSQRKQLQRVYSQASPTNRPQNSQLLNKQLDMVQQAQNNPQIDPSQVSQLLQLQQILLQQQQQQNPATNNQPAYMRQQSAPVALEANIPVPGFSQLIQQQQQTGNGNVQRPDINIPETAQLGYGRQPKQMQGQPMKPAGDAAVIQKKRAGTGPGAEHPYRRDENILCAILALLKELDKNGLEFVVKDCNKRIAKMDNFQ